MVVVVGSPSGRRAGRHVTAVGVGFAVARAIACRHVSAQLVGRVGDGPDGDKVVLSVAEAGVGHAALLRGAVPVVVSGSDQAEELDGSLEKIAGLASDAPSDSEGSLTGAGRQPDLDAEDLT